MNNRRRARIKAVIKERDAAIKAKPLSAISLTIWKYTEMIDRIRCGDDLADAQLRDFRRLCLGIPFDDSGMIWKKRIRFWTRAQGTHTMAIDVVKSARFSVTHGRFPSGLPHG